jgi:serine/threonine protein kinase
MELRSGTLLQGGKYKIVKSLGQGGFGITYLAEQTNLGREVCIKEFFMKEYGERTAAPEEDSEETVLTGVSAVTSAAATIMGRYREKFVKEARTIARLDHPGIVRIHDVFEENGTAYYVMDFIEGENLNDLVKREGTLSEERALGYIRQVADALSYVHGHNIMHLDVKPANIIIRKSDDKAILIDFGTAKQYDSEGAQTSTTPVGLSAGYAPIEMTKPGGVQTFSPETDVYSLGATLYYLVTGQNPPDASERMEMIMDGEKFKLPEKISATTANVIERSMQARKKRVQTVNGFMELLNSDGEKKSLEAERKRLAEEETRREAEAEQKRITEEKSRKETAEKAEKENNKKKKSLGWILGGIAAVCALVLLLTKNGTNNSVGEMTTNVSSQSYKQFVIPKPNFNGSTLSYAHSDYFTLKQKSVKSNNITDDAIWFQNNNLQLDYSEYSKINYDLSVFPSEYKSASIFYSEEYQGYYAAYYGNSYSDIHYILLAEKDFNIRYALDFTSFKEAPFVNPGDEGFVSQSVRYAHIVGDVLYVQHGHMTYAYSSGGQNAYISAIDLTSGNILWTTEPLTSNCNFIIVDDTIICGYGFTAEDDYLYLVDIKTGRRRQSIKVASGPEIIIRKNEQVYVRTYNKDYVFDIIR